MLKAKSSKTQFKENMRVIISKISRMEEKHQKFPEEIQDLIEKNKKLIISIAKKHFDIMFTPLEIADITHFANLIDIKKNHKFQKLIGKKLTEKNWKIDWDAEYKYGSFEQLIDSIDDRYLNPEKLIKIYANQMGRLLKERNMLDFLSLRDFYPEKFEKYFDKERVLNDIKKNMIMSKELVKGLYDFDFYSLYGKILKELGEDVQDLVESLPDN